MDSRYQSQTALFGPKTVSLRCHRFVTALFGAEKCAMEKRVRVLVAREVELRDIFPQSHSCQYACLGKVGSGLVMRPRCPKRFLTDIFGQFIASCPVADFIGHCATSRTARGCCELIYNHTTPKCPIATRVRARCESATTQRYHFVTATPKKTCLKDLSRATSRRSWTTAR